MKKSLIALLALFLCLNAFAQDKDEYYDDEKPKPRIEFPSPFKFTLIDSVKGTKDELYVKAHSWMAKTFNSANAVIQMQDKEAGKLIGKALFSDIKGQNGLCCEIINYTVTIDVKEGRYRVIFSDFYDDHNTGSAIGGYGSLDQQEIKANKGNYVYRFYNKLWDKIKINTQQKSNILMSDIKIYMHLNSDDKF